MEWPRALDHAKDIRLLLQPCCERIEIAGSLRRLRAEVNDIEFVVQPKMQPFDMLNARLADMVAHHWLYPGPASKNMKRPPMGPRYYRLAVPIGGVEDRLQLDIFAVLPPADFGVIFAIRTGSAEYSHWLVTEALRKGMKVQDGQLFRIHRDEHPWRFEKISCPQEMDFFRALGIEYIHPSSRQQPATMPSGGQSP